MFLIVYWNIWVFLGLEGWRLVVILILLCLVNLMVLFSRLVIIWWSWFGFVFIVEIWMVEILMIIFMFFFWVICVIDCMRFFIRFWMLMFKYLSLSLLVLIFEKFKILLMRFNRVLVLVFVIFICWVCLFVKFVFLSSVNMLMMLFIGVFILWFMLVRNLDLSLVVFLVLFIVFFKL